MFHVPTAFNRVDGEILYGNSRAGVVILGETLKGTRTQKVALGKHSHREILVLVLYKDY